MSNEPPMNDNSPRLPNVNEVPEAYVRRMDHAKWLDDFSKLLDMPRNGQLMPMTPFRAGAISRLKMAARYIVLLKQDLKKLKEKQDGSIEDATEGR